MDPTKKELYTDKRASGLSVDSDPALNDNLGRFRSGEINWIATKIVNNKQLVFHASGSDGYMGYIAAITDDDVYFGAIKAVVNGNAKVFHFGYIGPNTGALKKGKSTMQKNAAFGVIEAHGELLYNCEKEALNEALIVKNIARMMGTTVDNVQLV
jgi:hypothetical protein